MNLELLAILISMVILAIMLVGTVSILAYVKQLNPIPLAWCFAPVIWLLLWLAFLVAWIELGMPFLGIHAQTTV